MEKRENLAAEYYSIDVVHVFRTLWSKLWAIILCGVIVAVMGFCVSCFLIKPKYSSQILLYVNNSSFSLGNTSFSISSSEISAAQSLVKTYGVLLENRTTLERVKEKANVNYEIEELAKMIETESAEGTEVMRIEIISTNPYEASRIANSIAQVLPVRIAEIIDGASMEVVDFAVPDLEKISPSVTAYSALGFVLGVFVSVIIFVIVALTDDTIHDEEYIIRTYECPILARIPDLVNAGGKQYSYYSYKSRKHNK